ncbi:hypothetical protein DRN69_02435 [Candidatus Pacearchaeota archaeon]|nr:MAG: hypothetical protein DRN69_02435 [Candidatus Pacearchaeota archaeon]
MDELDKIKQKLKNLRQYSNLSDEELEELAREKLLEPKWEGLLSEEKKEAKKKYEAYKQFYNIKSYSDIELLATLIYNEVLENRYKKMIKQAANQKVLPTPSIVKSLGEIQDRILTIREKLGLLDKTKKNEFKIFIEKAKLYWKERGADQAVICPYCGEMIHLAPNMKYWEAHKFPFIKSRILYNEHLIKLYKENKITIEDVAKVLQTSVKYVEWVIKKFNQNNEK